MFDFFFLEYLQENEPLCFGPVNIHISFSPFIRGLMRINVCWIESMSPRLDTQRDWTGISSLKRSARVRTAASGSSALCISNRTKWGGNGFIMDLFCWNTPKVWARDVLSNSGEVSQSISCQCLLGWRGSRFSLCLPLLRWDCAREGSCFVIRVWCSVPCWDCLAIYL